jgi:hypothetical protein
MATVLQFNGGREVQRWDRVKDASVTRQEYGRVLTFEFFDVGPYVSEEPSNPAPTRPNASKIGMRRVTVSGDWTVIYEPVATKS